MTSQTPALDLPNIQQQALSTEDQYHLLKKKIESQQALYTDESSKTLTLKVNYPIPQHEPPLPKRLRTVDRSRAALPLATKVVKAHPSVMLRIPFVRAAMNEAWRASEDKTIDIRLDSDSGKPFRTSGMGGPQGACGLLHNHCFFSFCQSTKRYAC